MNPNEKRSIQFYFSLPRAVAMLFGGNAQRSESNGLEAALVGVWTYAIHYLFFATRFLPFFSTRLFIPFFLVLVGLALWPIWLLFVYFDSLLIKFVRRLGLFRNLPMRRSQNIVWGIITTIMAGDVL